MRIVLLPMLTNYDPKKSSGGAIHVPSWTAWPDGIVERDGTSREPAIGLSTVQYGWYVNMTTSKQ